MANYRGKNCGRRVAAALLCGLFSMIFLASAVLFWHYPHYLREKEAVTIEPKSDAVTIMSYDVRCLTLLDLGKKAGFTARI